MSLILNVMTDTKKITKLQDISTGVEMSTTQHIYYVFMRKNSQNSQLSLGFEHNSA